MCRLFPEFKQPLIFFLLEEAQMIGFDFSEIKSNTFLSY